MPIRCAHGHSIIPVRSQNCTILSTMRFSDALRMSFCLCIILSCCFVGSDSQNIPKALVLDATVYSSIRLECSAVTSIDNNYEYSFSSDYSLLDYFVLAPTNIVTPQNAIAAYQLYRYLASTNYSAIVAPFSPFIPSIAQSYNMLYYIYDYNFNIELNTLLEQVNETTVQQQYSILNKYVRVAFSYYSLYQVAFQMVFNVQNDPLLANYNSQLLFIICDSALYAMPAIASTSGKAVSPVVLALDQYIGSPIYSTKCSGSIDCLPNITCADSCAIYNLLLPILQGVNTMSSTGTIIVMLSAQSQVTYLGSIIRMAIKIGLMSSQLLWIITELWLQPFDYNYLTSVAAPVYVISIPTLDVVRVKSYICGDFFYQFTYLAEDRLPCALSSSNTWYCNAPYAYDPYTGYLPTALQYNVRMIPFNSRQYFQSFVEQQTVSVKYSSISSTPYIIPATPTASSISSNVTEKSGNGTFWAPYPNNCDNYSPYLPYPVVTSGRALLTVTTLSGRAIDCLGVIQEPWMMRVNNYDALLLAIKVQTLQNHSLTKSAMIHYSPDCSEDSHTWCFYNASFYGFADPNYKRILKNASVAAGGESNIRICPESVIMPFIDNSALYTGYSAQLLQLVKQQLNISLNIKEFEGDIHAMAQEFGSGSLNYGLTAVDILINSFNQKFVDFTSPSLTTGVTLMMSNQTFDATWQILYPFGTFVWILIIVTIFVIVFTLYACDHLSPNGPKHYTLLDNFSYVYASFTQAALDITPSRLSARVLSMNMWFCVALLLSSYTSSQTVVLLTPPSQGNVAGLFDLLTNGVMFAISPFSIAYYMLQDPNYSNLSANHKFTGQIMDVYQYFNQDNNITSYKQFAFVGDTRYISYYYAKYCSTWNISVIGQPQYVQFKAFGAPKNASYLLPINNALLNLTASGSVFSLRSYWFPDSPSSCSFTTHAKSLSYTDMAGLYYILIGGCAASLLALGLELLTRRLKFAKQRRRAPQLQFGQVYEATVIGSSIEGVTVDIKAQPTSYFIPYENLNFGNLDLRYPEELGIVPGTVLYVKYFGIERKTNLARLVLVKIEQADTPGTSTTDFESSA